MAEQYSVVWEQSGFEGAIGQSVASELTISAPLVIIGLILVKYLHSTHDFGEFGQ